MKFIHTRTFRLFLDEHEEEESHIGADGIGERVTDNQGSADVNLDPPGGAW